jgi:hypothetical protein
MGKYLPCRSLRPTRCKESSRSCKSGEILTRLVSLMTQVLRRELDHCRTAATR